MCPVREKCKYVFKMCTVLQSKIIMLHAKFFQSWRFFESSPAKSVHPAGAGGINFAVFFIIFFIFWIVSAFFLHCIFLGPCSPPPLVCGRLVFQKVNRLPQQEGSVKNCWARPSVYHNRGGPPPWAKVLRDNLNASFSISQAMSRWCGHPLPTRDFVLSFVPRGGGPCRAGVRPSGY